jgi:hypothetical protein
VETLALGCTSRRGWPVWRGGHLASEDRPLQPLGWDEHACLYIREGGSRSGEGRRERMEIHARLLMHQHQCPRYLVGSSFQKFKGLYLLSLGIQTGVAKQTLDGVSASMTPLIPPGTSDASRNGACLFHPGTCLPMCRFSRAHRWLIFSSPLQTAATIGIYREASLPAGWMSLHLQGWSRSL